MLHRTKFGCALILFCAGALTAQVQVQVDAAKVLQTVDTRHFGVNLAVWDRNYTPPNDAVTTALLREMGCLAVRLLGGSVSDEYHWASNTSLSNSWQWMASFPKFLGVITNAGVQTIITVNYGTGTPEEAAAWVRHANFTNRLGCRYWEIGNECYGPWETDSNSSPHDPFVYATRVVEYLKQMRAADPKIKIGVVATPGENSYVNGRTNHPAYNARTGQTNFGWTPVMLATLKQLGAKPDFLIHHGYPQHTDEEHVSESKNNDTNLLQCTTNWAAHAADLRQQITDYFGSGGSDIELVVTENNADSGAPGRQSTSLVNGLYYADSLAQLLQTEFRGFYWWDLRNGAHHKGFFGPDIHGWRDYGDMGMVSGPDTRHPTFYAAKLMQWYARPGDKILNATSDDSLLAAYACRHGDSSLALLVLNKSLQTNLTARIGFKEFKPAPSALVRSFGIPNDEAARTNGPASTRDISTNRLATAGSTFEYNFPRLSMTLFMLHEDEK